MSDQFKQGDMVASKGFIYVNQFGSGRRRGIDFKRGRVLEARRSTLVVETVRPHAKVIVKSFDDVVVATASEQTPARSRRVNESQSSQPHRKALAREPQEGSTSGRVTRPKTTDPQPELNLDAAREAAEASPQPEPEAAEGTITSAAPPQRSGPRGKAKPTTSTTRKRATPKKSAGTIGAARTKRPRKPPEE